jgi:magnesium transporter
MLRKLEETKELLRTLIEEKKWGLLREELLELNPVDIADFLEELDRQNALPVFRLLSKETAADVFSYMEPEVQEALIGVLTDRELQSVVQELYMDDVADIIDEMPANIVKRVLKVSAAGDRNVINQLLKYPEDSAGSVLTTEFVALKAHMTVEEALQYIRRFGPDKETIYTCYVTDAKRRLLGVISVKDLLLADADKTMEDLMHTNVISAVTTEDQETVAGLFAKYDLIALPVVDKEKRLVGIITVDDVVDIMQRETTEDIEKMAAILPTERSYFRTGVWETFSKRIPWLLLLMISATVTGLIITKFENALSSMVALVAYMPMLMDTGGNCGSQASVTIIRSLALGDVEFKDIFRVIWKEVRVSLVCGGVLALANFVKILVLDNLVLGSGVSIGVAAVICVTILITVVIAKLVGCTLPLLAKKIGFDPAVMASPFITTIVDALSLMVYFGIATSFLM